MLADFYCSNQRDTPTMGVWKYRSNKIITCCDTCGRFIHYTNLLFLIPIEIPPQAILNMKANFVLPDVEEDYGEVFYTDLGPKDAEDQIGLYNKEAWSTGCDMNGAVKAFVNR